MTKPKHTDQSSILARPVSKLVSAFLVMVLACGLFVAAPKMAYAANTDITGTSSESIDTFQTRIQNAINASNSGDTVTVLGPNMDQAVPLSFDIKNGVTLIWKRSWGSPVSVTNLISITGGGVFEVAGGGWLGIAEGNSGTVINAGSDATVLITGGTVQAGTGRAISAYYVSVNGGTVSAQGNSNVVIESRSVEIHGGRVEAKGQAGAINATGIEVYGGTVTARAGTTINSNGAGVVRVFGGNVENTGSGIAISASGVEVHDGIVSSTSGRAISATTTDSVVEVYGGTVSSGTNSENSAAIYARNITVSGGVVEARGSGNAILATTKFSTLTISGGVVCATTGFAIYADDNSTINISGGFVFAYGKQILHSNASNKGVLLLFEENYNVTAGGIICAWNKDAGHSEYLVDTADDLTVRPTGRAVWGIHGGTVFGIAYSNGSNTGFFQVGGVHVAEIPKPPSYNVTVVSGTANVVSAPSGTTINITANAAPSGKVFDRWTSSDGVSFASATSSSTSFVMPEKPVTVTATYVELPPNTYAINVTTTGSGTANASPSSAAAGATITLTATPGNGYRFVEWQVTGGSVTITDNTFTMPASNVTIAAVFEAIPGGDNDNNGNNNNTSNGTADTNSMTWLWILLGCLAVLAIAGVVTYVVIRKKAKINPTVNGQEDPMTWE